MPGMEIFTISGPALGASASPPVLLQNALKALGDAHGDGTLSAVTVDGAIGPKTVSAVNYAAKTYVGAGPLKAAGLSGRFLNATATKSDIQQYAATLATVFIQAVKSAGGTVPDPVVSAAKHHASAASMLPVAPIADQSMTLAQNPNLIWVLGGVGLIVVALGFVAAKKRAAA